MHALRTGPPLILRKMTSSSCLSPELVVALSGGGVALVGAIGGAWIKLVQVHRTVNGNLANAQRDLRDLRESLRHLTHQNADLRRKSRPTSGEL